MRIFILSFVFAGVFSALGMAQNNKPSVKMIYSYVGDSVVVRIAPSDVTTWIALQKHGCVLEKGEKKVYRNMTNLNLWNQDQWKPIVLGGNEKAAVSAQAFFGKSFAALTGDVDMNQLKNAATEMEMRFVYSLMMADFDVVTAYASGWRWSEKVKQTNEVISYRAYIPGIVNADTAVVFVNLSKRSPELSQPEGIRTVEKEKRIDIQWDILKINQVYSAWWIERSKDGKTFNRLNKSPYVANIANQESEIATAVFVDSTLTRNYEGYYYRISGINSFTQNGPQSKVVYAMARDRTPPASPELEPPEEKGDQMILKWKMPFKASDLKGFQVEAAYDNLGPFQAIQKEWIKPNKNELSIATALLKDQKYLRVIASDTAGNTSVSLTVYAIATDSIAPELPANFRGKIDSTGNVTLNWSPVNAKDLLGFRILYSNSPDHEFSQLSDKIISDTSFSHRLTLKTLSSHIYYQIVSVDQRFNHSEPSNTLKLTKPDTIGPVMPVFINYHVSDSAVVLTFINSTSKDVELQRLLRKDEGSDNWKIIHSWQPDSAYLKYTDREIMENTYYQYTLEAVDSSGNVSGRTLPIKVKVYRKRSHDIIAEFAAKKQSNGVELTWGKTELKVKEFIILRKTNSETSQRLATVSGAENMFLDTGNLAKGIYTYSIRAIFENGRVSAETLATAPVIIN